MNLILQQLLERLTLELGAVAAEKIVSKLAPMVAEMVANNLELVIIVGVLLGIAYYMYKNDQQQNVPIYR